MKPSMLILLAAAALAFYFVVMKKGSVTAAPLGYPTAPSTASRTPTPSLGDRTLDTAIKAAPGLIQDGIGWLFGGGSSDD